MVGKRVQLKDKDEKETKEEAARQQQIEIGIKWNLHKTHADRKRHKNCTSIDVAVYAKFNVCVYLLIWIA